MRRLFIQFATALALVIAPVVAFASPLVSPAWLSENLDDAKLVIIDLRNKIDEGSYETFLEGHIPGAIHSDYLKDGWRVGRDGVGPEAGIRSTTSHAACPYQAHSRRRTCRASHKECDQPRDRCYSQSPHIFSPQCFTTKIG